MKLPAAFFMSLVAACCAAVLACIMLRYGDTFGFIVLGAMTFVCLGLAAVISRQERP